MAALWIGTSGWVYKHRIGGVFYPPGLRPAEQFPFYAGQFRTVEINFSYYKLPERATFEAWRRQSPEGFLFAVKASRYLTHLKKLNEPEEPLQRLMQAAGGLEDKLGPILFQFPHWWRLNLPRLEAFVAALGTRPGHRWAFEFRHQSWLVPEVFGLLERHGAALCLPVGWGIPLDVHLTSNWTYVRFHGGQHGNAFGDDELEPWAQRLRAWLGEGRDVYAYFNNDPSGDAPRNAHRLRDLLAW